jgi:streptogramin lyase
MRTGTTIGAVLLGVCLTARIAEAGELTAWRLPFSAAQPLQVAAGAGGVSYVDFDGGTGATLLGLLDTDRGRFREIQIPFFAGSGDLRVRPDDGAVFLTDAAVGDLGQGDVVGRRFRRWTPPGGVGVRSFVFDGASVVLFLGGDADGRMSVGRLDTATGDIAIWPLPDSMALPGDDFAWRIVRAADGTVIVNVNGFAHPGQLVRLDLATGVFTAWVTPAAPVFPLVADAAGRIYFQEIAGGVRRIARLVPATGQLTEWNFPIPDVDFTGEMALESGRLLFALNNPIDMAALDPSAPGDESLLAPFVAAPVTPSTAVISPVVTRHARSRAGSARPTVSTVPATAMGAFTTWDTGANFVSVGSGTGSGAVFGTGDVGGPAIIKFVP